MAEVLLLKRCVDVLQGLLRLAAERHQAEETTEQEYSSATEAFRQEFQEIRKRTQERYEKERFQADQLYREARQTIPDRAQVDYEETSQEYLKVRQKISTDFATARDRTQKEFQDARWTIRTIYEAGKKEVKEKLQELERIGRKARTRKHRLEAVQQKAVEFLILYRQVGVYQGTTLPTSTMPVRRDPFKDLKYCLNRAQDGLGAMQGLTLARWYRGWRLLLLFLIPGLAAFYPVGWLAVWDIFLVAGIVAAAVLSLGGGIAAGCYLGARRKLRRVYQPLCQAVADGLAVYQRCKQDIQAQHQNLLAQLATLKERRNLDLHQAQQKAQQQFAALDQKRAEDSRKVEDHYPPRLVAIRAERDAALSDAEMTYRHTLALAEDCLHADVKKAEDHYTGQCEERKARYQQAWNELSQRWQTGLTAVLAEITAINRQSETLFPPWEILDPQEWKQPTSVPPGMRFGTLPIKMSDIPNGLPRAESLRSGVPEEFTLPALLPFPRQASMLFKASDAGRVLAVQAVQALMMRFLTALPAGKVRFTIIDPVGLGENFAAFMHLADYDEALVSNRIWTEQHHIEQRLADLTAHMENVIQKYLRNQFQTIEEYNVQAGEVAEPFRVLVVANFPANFSVEAARRLLSITTSGARCGVYTLVSVDTRLPVPQGFNLKDLESPSLTLVWKEGRFLWKNPDFDKYPLQLDSPPDDARAMGLFHCCGEAARGVKRVEVPFEVVAPAEEEYWSQSSRKGIDVPLGRAGATRLQHLKLGQGTAQHVLIAGKTGSGKSTLLHALITNLSLLYSPQEVELYLVDFKKGVEFKTYATGDLPHARVVAIESEREFGLSVLQRLDAELKARGDLFRQAGVQDIASFRDTAGRTELIPFYKPAASAEEGSEPTVPGNPPSCPRILLIVDEFQEFFVEDDKIAQEAALLLDRLVRQGRAFGIHVHLGSQTLSGAYTLARSTIDQMAVRIALQCSESDAYLILSKDNAAARLLSRPGEAIYNDANGLVEGNDVFQVVWLPDERRDEYLRRIRERAQRLEYRPPHRTIVFEGNVPADLTRNDSLRLLLEAPGWPAPSRVMISWLGEAVAIKEPTAAVFRDQSGANLLIVGQQEESALGLMAAALIGLGTQQAPDRTAFFVLDGTPQDSPLFGQLSQVCKVLPHRVTQGNWREAATVLGELAAEVNRRQQAPGELYPALFLLINGLQRFRELRRSEDDFGLPRRGEERSVSPAQQLATLLREGPGLGIHVLVWCDSLNNLNRSFDRPSLRELEMRVLFQMNAADSSTLIDNPLASKLGVHRALFHSEDRSVPEKFRPYGLPTEEWLSWVKQRLCERLKGSKPDQT